MLHSAYDEFVAGCQQLRLYVPHVPQLASLIVSPLSHPPYKYLDICIATATAHFNLIYARNERERERIKQKTKQNKMKSSQSAKAN